MRRKITDRIYNIGVYDRELDLFEGQYFVPEGITYNSYLILDEKPVITDTVDARAESEWLKNLSEILGERKPEYLVISHMEPDHSGSIEALIKKYPDIKLVGNAQTFKFLKQFTGRDFISQAVIVKEGDRILTGSSELTFMMAPMIHWPEVMVCYDSADGVLFSADGFGRFGSDDESESWACEARRYYFNIVGKYGAQVQSLLKKVGSLEIKGICPLHGPVLTENLEFYLNKYSIWSSYEPEDKGVFIACASIHGNTLKAAKKLEEMLKAKGIKTAFNDLTRDDMAEAVEDAFRYDRMVLCAPTYDGGLFPAMEDFLSHLKAKTYRNRRVGLVENGTWAPQAAKVMRKHLEELKDVEIISDVVSIKSALNEESETALLLLADMMAAED